MEYEVIIQFIKYAVAGGIATSVHILIFHMVAWRLFPSLQEKDYAVRILKLRIVPVDDARRARNSMIGNILSFMVSNMVAYILNILWVFEAGRHHVLVEILMFYTVSGISLLIGTVIMGYLIKRFWMLTTYAFASNIVTAVMINYAVRKFVIFSG